MRRVLIIIFLITYTFIGFCQQSSQLSKMEVALLYHFGENIIWDKEKSIKTFNIGYLGKNPDTKNFLDQLAKSQKIKGKPISIVTYSYTTQVDYSNIQVLFMDATFNPQLKTIYKDMGKNQTLIVTEYSDNKKMVMINYFVSEDSRIKFEINKSNILIQGMNITSQLMFYGGTEIDVATVYQEAINEMEGALDSLQKERDKASLYLQQVNLLKKDVLAKEKELLQQQELIERRNALIEQQKKDISNKNLYLQNIDGEIQKIRNIINIKNQDLLKKQTEIDRKEKEALEKQSRIRSFDDKIQKQIAFINEQEKKINDQSNALDQSFSTIKKQKQVLMMAGIVTAIVVFLVILTFSAYRSKNKAYQQLEYQTIQIHEQKEELKAQRDELNVTNIKIEEQKEELEKTLKDLKETQTMLVHSEKMASLGLVTAGIAHEINTPLGAINASADNINTYFPVIADNVSKITSILNEENVVLYSKLMAPKDNFGSLSTKETRAHRRDLKKQLDEANVQNSDELSRLMVEMGIHENWQEYKSILESQYSLVMFTHAYNFYQIHFNSQNIKAAVKKASKVLFALKKYSSQDQSDKKTKIGIADNLETVLTIYHNHLKHIELNLDFPKEDLEVIAYPDELSQIWTNIIHNALQAMEYKGRLDIGISKKDKFAQVYFRDYGAGIPEEIKDKIFKPFFSTKSAGEGSGLGLDIVRKIIDKHEGEISFESELGKGTTFFINIPLDQTKA